MIQPRQRLDKKVICLVTCLVFVQLCCSGEGKERIVGGKAVTSQNTYPFYAIPAADVLCGAALIWGNVLITAAHCGEQAWSSGIWLGGLKSDKSSSHFYSTRKVIIHPQYDTKTNVNDIALVILNSFVSNVTYAPLNFNKNIPQVDSVMTAIGYGKTNEYGKMASTLQTVDLFVESYTNCAKYFSIPEETTMCNRGLPQGGKDTCQGDSGGPLFIKGRSTVIGLVSYGFGCARPNFPAINTRVSTFEQWIKVTVCSQFQSPSRPSYCTKSLGSQTISLLGKTQVNHKKNNDKAHHILSPVATNPSPPTTIAVTEPIVSVPNEKQSNATAPIKQAKSGESTGKGKSDKPVETKPIPDKSVETKPIPDKSVEKKPIPDQSVATKPIPDKSVETKPVKDKQVMMKPKQKKPVAPRPKTNAPVVYQPQMEPPIASKPKTDKSTEIKPTPDVNTSKPASDISSETKPKVDPPKSADQRTAGNES